MSDTTTDDQDDAQQASDNLADLRRAADDGRQARAETERLNRELAFVKAGIDTEAGVGKLLFQSYQGEPTREAVLEAATEYGITPAGSEPPPAVQIPESERTQSRERAALGAQSEPPAGTEPSPDPATEGLRRFREAKAQGRTETEAAAAYYGEVLTAAAQGDKRVIHDPEEWKARARES